MDLLKCIGAPSFVTYLLSIGLFVFVYILYWIFLSSLRKLFRNDGVWKGLVEGMRLPCLFILFEIAALTSINILGLKELYEEILEHTFVIVIISTIGWLLASIVRSVFRYFYFKYEESSATDLHQRAMITQILFLYRLIMFAIIAVTLAAIILTFPNIKSVGIGILSSAGIAGIALGVAARPILLNLMAGFQIAMTKTIKIGDAVHVENDFSRIEAIHLTHVVARTWDLRRIILPISYFIDHPFQNWDAKDPELLGSVFMHVDYSAPVEIIRKKVEEIITNNPNWNKKVWKLHVTECGESSLQLRIIMTAIDAPTAFELRSHVREKLIEFLQNEHPYALPQLRYNKVN